MPLIEADDGRCHLLLCFVRIAVSWLAKEAVAVFHVRSAQSKSSVEPQGWIG